MTSLAVVWGFLNYADKAMLVHVLT